MNKSEQKDFLLEKISSFEEVIYSCFLNERSRLKQYLLNNKDQETRLINGIQLKEIIESDIILPFSPPENFLKGISYGVSWFFLFKTSNIPMKIRIVSIEKRAYRNSESSLTNCLLSELSYEDLLIAISCFHSIQTGFVKIIESNRNVEKTLDIKKLDSSNYFSIKKIEQAITFLINSIKEAKNKIIS